jgi:hypothetical protein
VKRTAANIAKLPELLIKTQKFTPSVVLRLDRRRPSGSPFAKTDVTPFSITLPAGRGDEEAR